MTTTNVTQDQGRDALQGVTQQQFQQSIAALTQNISRTVVASEQSVRIVLLGLVTRGHILLEDTPGVGKTLMAKALAHSIQGRFTRIQCTPDLLPSDITGTSVFNMQQSHFEFKPGPVFSNILLADEINRTGPRTQAALLEAMAEFQVSAYGEVYPLPRPFMVIATQNRSESHGIFPLPDSQLDRFLIRMSLGMPNPTQELEILSRAEHGLPQISPVVTTQNVLAMQEVVRQVNVAKPVKQYLVNVAQATRENTCALGGISPRGTVSLQSAVQGWAALDGRTYMVPEDVKQVAPLVLPHRMVVRTGSDANREDVVQQILETVPVPL